MHHSFFKCREKNWIRPRGRGLKQVAEVEGDWLERWRRRSREHGRERESSTEAPCPVNAFPVRLLPPTCAGRGWPQWVQGKEVLCCWQTQRLPCQCLRGSALTNPEYGAREIRTWGVCVL